MSRRSLASLLLAGTTIISLAACTAGDPAAGKPPTVAAPPPADPNQLIAEGDRLAASGNVYAAIESYMTARRVASVNADAAARLGLTLADQGRHAEALPHLQDAQRMRGDDVVITRVLVNALLALERPDQAAAQLAPVLAQHPEDARLWNASGIAADMMGDGEGAATAYRTGLAAAPDNQSLKINLALSRLANGDVKGSEAAAAAAGLSMTEVQARAKRLVAYRNRVQARNVVAATAALGQVPEAPPMIALALPPVRVQELPPVAVAAPAPAPAPIAAAAPEDPKASMVSSTDAPAAEPVVADVQTLASQPEAAAPPAEAKPAESPTASAVAPTQIAAADPIPTATAPDQPAPAIEPATVAAAPQATAAPESAPGTTQSSASWAQSGKPQVQLAAYGRASWAEAQWVKLKAEHGDLLEGLEPVIQRAELGPEKGVVFRLRLAVADRSAGLALCERLRGAGLDCVPVPSL